MKVFNYALFIIMLLNINGNCDRLWGQDMTEDPYFMIKSANDTYNSQTNEFKRLYSGGIKTFKVQLTEKEQKAIFSAIKASRFNEFPKVYRPKSETITITTPSFKSILEVGQRGTVKMTMYDDAETDPQMEKEGMPFLSLYREIWRIIYSNETVKTIRGSDVFWE